MTKNKNEDNLDAKTGVNTSSKNTVCEYLSGFLNKEVLPNTEVKISSAQLSVIGNYLEKNGIRFDQDVFFKGRFTVNSILSGSSARSSGNNTQNRSFVAAEGENVPVSGLGFDIQLSDELKISSDPKSDEHLRAIFTERELSYAESRASISETLTGIFVAKEAIKKAASGTEVGNLEFSEIEIETDKNGRPCYDGFFISISHSGDYSAAVAVMKGHSSQSEAAVDNKTDGGDSLNGTSVDPVSPSINMFYFAGTVVAFLLLIERLWKFII